MRFGGGPQVRRQHHGWARVAGKRGDGADRGAGVLSEMGSKLVSEGFARPRCA